MPSFLLIRPCLVVLRLSRQTFMRTMRPLSLRSRARPYFPILGRPGRQQNPANLLDLIWLSLTAARLVPVVGVVEQSAQTDTQSCASPSTSESNSERSLLRDSPMAVTYTAGSSLTGHSCSQIPQPMHFTGSM